MQKEEGQEDQNAEIEDELDILDAYIDPLDGKNIEKKAKLLYELDQEKKKIRCKFLFKYARQDSDPFKLWS